MRSFRSDFSLPLSELYVHKSEPAGDLRISYKTAQCVVQWQFGAIVQKRREKSLLSSSREKLCLAKVGTLAPGLWNLHVNTGR